MKIKKRVLPILITLIVWFLMFYIYLPALNIKSKEFWQFLVVAVIVAAVINMWSIVKQILISRDTFERKSFFSHFKISIAIIFVLVLIYAGGSLVSSPIIRAKSYRELLKIETSDFKNDIEEVNYSQIPLLDKDSSAILAERKMGSMVDMVSQYEVSNYYSQINYQNKPMRVTPLEYASDIKWLTNMRTGIPAYIRIDMATQDVELVKLSESMKYSPADKFNRDLLRHIRFKYPTYMFRSLNFEIDDNGTPYWICPVANHTIGLFGGTDIKGAVLVNALTGENQYYDINDVPRWIDKVYDAELLVQQYNYYGTLINGFFNSILGQKGCLQTTEGYNYIALEDDVWVYTGVTSVSGDQSIVGFVLMNQRTKETKYYQISGAKEISAMSSAEGQVQNLRYSATFPLLLNIGGEPTYFIALKDASGLVKKYAMVNVEKYQIVAIGDTVGESEKNYKSLLLNSGISTTDSSEILEIKGKISSIKNIVSDGNSIYYIMLENNDSLFEINASRNLKILRLNEGDTISLKYSETVLEYVNRVISIDDVNIF